MYFSYRKGDDLIIDDKPEEGLAKEAPRISLTSTSNYVIQAGTVKIVANAPDNVGVTKVEFYNGNNLIGTDMEVPFSIILVIR